MSSMFFTSANNAETPISARDHAVSGMREVPRVIKSQLGFYQKNKAGCAFAALAARNPGRFGWLFRATNCTANEIDSEIDLAIETRSVSTMSLLFPSVNSEDDFREFLKIVLKCKKIQLEQDIEFKGVRCLGFRVPVGELKSWTTGFGNYSFLPITRRAPCVELAFRVKPRPNYKEVLKESPPGVIHLADMNMLGMADAMFRMLWKKTLQRTATMLGHPPDLRSAARTTFAVPNNFL